MNLLPTVSYNLAKSISQKTIEKNKQPLYKQGNKLWVFLDEAISFFLTINVTRLTLHLS